MPLIIKSPNPLRGRARGFSLVELLIGLAVGSLILAGAITVFAKISFSGIENVRMVRLNEQLRSTLGTISREIQRAGYVDAWPAAGGTSFDDLGFAAMGGFGVISLGGTCADGDGDGAVECDCIAYSYDEDKDGAFPPTGPAGGVLGDENFAFRLNANAIERDTVDGKCAGGVGWADMTDGEVLITALTFELDPGSTDVEVGDGAAVRNNDGVCDVGETCLARRKINIVLEGQLTADAAFTVRLRDAVKVRNDHYYVKP
ncbi:hypothetical protein A9Q89_12255 [Gammaproteobacteria bacterium 53_120_T64]|nr:hypothetical protein A9Q89_12255 [Gammaproteobacteria bacterium 53_120_T64]